MLCKDCGSLLLPVYSEQGWELACLKCGATTPCDPQGSQEAASLASQGRNYFARQSFEQAQERFTEAARRSGGKIEYRWGALLAHYGVKYCKSDVNPGGSDYVVNHWLENLPEKRMQDTQEYREIADAAAARSAALLNFVMNEAEAVDRGIAQIHRLAQEETVYDIFLCFKDMDAQGDPTPERRFLDALYPELVGTGDLRVFYSPRSMYNKLVTDFEGYIYTALKTAKLMVVVGSTTENVTSPWVASEWERFRRWGKNAQILLLPVGDMYMSNFPQELCQIQSDLAMGVPLSQLTDRYILKWAAKEIRFRWEKLAATVTPVPKPVPGSIPKPGFVLESSVKTAPNPTPVPKPTPSFNSASDPSLYPEPKPVFNPAPSSGPVVGSRPVPVPTPEIRSQPAFEPSIQINAPVQAYPCQSLRQFKRKKRYYWVAYIIIVIVIVNMCVNSIDAISPYLIPPLSALYKPSVYYDPVAPEALPLLVISFSALLGALIGYIWDEKALKQITDVAPEELKKYRSFRWHRNWVVYYLAFFFFSVAITEFYSCALKRFITQEIPFMEFYDSAASLVLFGLGPRFAALLWKRWKSKTANS